MKPVSAVSTVTTRPASNASHQPWAPAVCRDPDRTSVSAAIVANVYMPIVASVSGGWIGCPGSPLTRYRSFTRRVACRTRSGEERYFLSGLEEAQERGVLAEQILDLRDAGARPVLDPGLGQVVLDVMEAALVHPVMIGQEMGVGNGPGGSS